MVDYDWKYIYFYNNRQQNLVYLTMPVRYINWIQAPADVAFYSNK